ncbi:MAG: hypothetical protein BGO70_12945 [Bacteroidetes bacterium 43-93]|nr:hypothetical protein [Bacteroidota bacterium]OJW99346.1 MAG: hypothetical protein BGO70_12945 [Bacteroidetes bacterium 43-93]
MTCTTRQVIIIFLILFPTAGFAQKINKEKFAAEAPSLIQFYEYEREIQHLEEDVAYLFASEDVETQEGKEMLSNVIQREKKLQKKITTTKIDQQYTKLKTQLIDLIDAIVVCFDQLKNYGSSSNEFKNANAAYQPKLEKHVREFNQTFSEHFYIEIDSAKYAATKAKACELDYSEKNKSIVYLKENKPITAYKTILSNNSLSSDAVKMQLSDILLKSKYGDSMNNYIVDKDSVALSFLSTIVNAPKYSPFYYEAWRKWRADLQLNYGASKTSDIPNDLYDDKRFSIMWLILNHIKSEPDDTWAYLQFFDLATIEIIHRFGPYDYGNQSAIERAELFYQD